MRFARKIIQGLEFQLSSRSNHAEINKNSGRNTRAIGLKWALNYLSAAMALLIECEASPEKIGIVVSDWNMPKMSGLEFLKQVRSTDHWQQLPFILLTSESEREQVTEAVLAGVSQYVVKPFAGKAFEEKLNSAWNKHNKAKA